MLPKAKASKKTKDEPVEKALGKRKQVSQVESANDYE